MLVSAFVSEFSIFIYTYTNRYIYIPSPLTSPCVPNLVGKVAHNVELADCIDGRELHHRANVLGALHGIERPHAHCGLQKGLPVVRYDQDGCALAAAGARWARVEHFLVFVNLPGQARGHPRVDGQLEIWPDRVAALCVVEAVADCLVRLESRGLAAHAGGNAEIPPLQVAVGAVVFVRHGKSSRVDRHLCALV
jgi:hypothetical protein